jgi:hypothetical protein
VTGPPSNGSGWHAPTTNSRSSSQKRSRRR